MDHSIPDACTAPDLSFRHRCRLKQYAPRFAALSILLAACTAPPLKTVRDVERCGEECGNERLLATALAPENQSEAQSFAAERIRGDASLVQLLASNNRAVYSGALRVRSGDALLAALLTVTDSAKLGQFINDMRCVRCERGKDVGCAKNFDGLFCRQHPAFEQVVGGIAKQHREPDCRRVAQAAAEWGSPSVAATAEDSGPEPPATERAQEANLAATNRIRGWGDAQVKAILLPGSGVCPLEAGRFSLVSSFAVEHSEGAESREVRPGIHIDTAACEALEDSYSPISGVLLRVQSVQDVAVPLVGGAASLGGATPRKSIALLAPLEPGSSRAWVRTFERGSLVLEIPGRSTIDLVFVFEGLPTNKSEARLLVSGLELPFAPEPAPLTIETRKRWSLRDSRIPRTKKPCRTDAKLSASGGRYEFAEGSSLDFVDGTPVYWCPGAKHQWIGRSTNVLDFLSVIASSDSDPLRFEVTTTAYQYRGGRGYVRLEDGTVVNFPGAARPRP